MLSNLFKRKINVKSNSPYLENDLEEVIINNRKTLKEIDNWIDEAAFSKSFYKYGVPDYIKLEINKELNNSATYSDYIIKIGEDKFEQINYLEIGVSVGKNFFQILNGFKTGSFTGFDIEEINPVIEKKFTLENISQWETIPNSIKKNQSSIRRYSYNGKNINYVAADIWDINSWSKLAGSKFNIVFSDALHTSEAILFEFEMLVKNDLLADRFVIIWDDLIGEMQKSFFEILKKCDKAFKIKEAFLFDVNGWIGQHEIPHTVGIVSNFSFKK